MALCKIFGTMQSMPCLMLKNLKINTPARLVFKSWMIQNPSLNNDTPSNSYITLSCRRLNASQEFTALNRSSMTFTKYKPQYNSMINCCGKNLSTQEPRNSNFKKLLNDLLGMLKLEVGSIITINNNNLGGEKKELKTGGEKNELKIGGEKNELKKKLCSELSTFLGQENDLEIRQLKMNVDFKDENYKFQKLSYENLSHSHVTKVILLVGQTGSGKTTLINNIVNFIYGVEYSDKFRLKLIEELDTSEKSKADSQTDYITAYVIPYIEGMRFKYNCILIDTPGFGDTRGIQRDKQTMKQLERFLTHCEDIGSVDGVGFVTNSTNERLTQTQIYVYDGIQAMFGKDIKNNLFIMATFSDGDQPNVIEAVKKADIKYADVYNFNNSALYKDVTKNKIRKHFWELGYKSLKRFCIDLGKRAPASLRQTKEVLEERRQLETVIGGLKLKIQLGLEELANLEKTRRDLSNLTNEMAKNENHTQEKEEIVIVVGKSFVARLFNFFGTEFNGVIHKSIVNHEILELYNKAEEGKLSKEQAVKLYEASISISANSILDLIQEAQKHNERLEEIALKPKPLGTKEYIEILIISEKEQEGSNKLRNIQVLEILKDIVFEETLHTVNGEDLFKFFQDKIYCAAK